MLIKQSPRRLIQLYSITIFFADVLVFVPTMLSIGEEDEMVQVCAILSALEDTEKDFIVTLATNDDTGTCFNKTEFYNYVMNLQPLPVLTTLVVLLI